MKKTVVSLIILSIIIINLRNYELNTNGNSLTVNEPISINSDDDFETMGFQGLGTSKKPYLIENLLIEGNVSVGISITYTTKHFLIRNCQISTRVCGIKLGIIAKRTAKIENTIIGNSTYGLHLTSSNETTIQSNQIDKCKYGIYILNSGSCDIKSNALSQITFNAIYIQYSSEVKIIDNTIEENTDTGIKLENSNECLIIYNNFIKIQEYSVNLASTSRDNIIHHNNFETFFSNLNSLGKDNGQYNEWYDAATEEGNYWSNFAGHGTYTIEGTAGAEDMYPIKDKVTYIEKASFGWFVLVSILGIAILNKRIKRR